MATPTELRRLLDLLAGFPTSEQQDRWLLKVPLCQLNATVCCTADPGPLAPLIISSQPGPALMVVSQTHRDLQAAAAGLLVVVSDSFGGACRRPATG